MSLDRDRALERIRKCLALAGSPEPHEAASALRQAAKLMQMHGITEAEASGPEVKAFRARCTTANPKRWQINLARIVGAQMRCTVLTIKIRSLGKPAMFFEYVGEGPAAEMAAYAFEQLVRQCAAGRRDFRAESRKNPYLTTDRITKLADGWCEGWAIGIAQKLMEYAKPDPVPDSVDAHINGKGIPMAKERKSSIKPENIAAARAGFAAGQDVSLHRGMGKGDGPLAITQG